MSQDTFFYKDENMPGNTPILALSPISLSSSSIYPRLVFRRLLGTGVKIRCVEGVAGAPL